MPEVAAIAKDLLERGVVKAVIGYAAAGPNRTRPFIARTAEQANALVFNRHALNNLAVFLTRRRKPVAGPVAVVAKGCDVRALIMLMQEQQVRREDVHIIGVTCGGVASSMGTPWSVETAAPKCAHCRFHTPHLYDSLAEGTEEVGPLPDRSGERIKELEALPPDERFAFWAEQFSRCIRCYACREVCPICSCEQCVADKNQPQWIDRSPTSRGNFAWNLVRAFHLAGRCIGCNECERACPADIPLSLLNRKLAMTALEEFHYIAGTDPAAPTLVGTYDKTDRQDYIA
ncbi:MAG: 4Fe-4S dicluster domain-containing protein [Bacteroidota bacterium]|nr:4Fe-4S dicluster domain-containing protein [Bacteroidota bacterium]